jgi:hypothetical protein
MPSPRKSQSRVEAVRLGFRSDFEKRIAECLDELGTYWEYEPFAIAYEAKPKKYTPDFILPNGVIIEAKGRFTSSDRAKHLLLKTQRPELDIRFVFQYDNKLTRSSNTRYSDWCKSNGFLFALREVPKEWLEPTKSK